MKKKRFNSYRRFRGYYRTATRYRDIKTDNKSRGFIYAEFFSGDINLVRKVAVTYEGLYGKSAANYMQKTYNSWKNGWVKISDESLEKILQCVPPNLNKEKKLQLLSFQYDAMISTMINSSWKWGVDINEINAIFEELKRKAKTAEVRLDWFISSLFDNEAKELLIELFRISLVKTIDIVYDGFIKDIALLKRVIELPYLKEIGYVVDIGEIRIRIDQKSLDRFKPKDLEIDDEYSIRGEDNDIIVGFIFDRIHELKKMSFKDSMAFNDVIMIEEVLKNMERNRLYELNTSIISGGGVIRLIVSKHWFYVRLIKIIVVCAIVIGLISLFVL